MKIYPVNKKIMDVFIDIDTQYTGFEPEAWLRVQKNGKNWIQIAGTKVPSWKFKMVTEKLNTCV